MNNLFLTRKRKFAELHTSPFLAMIFLPYFQSYWSAFNLVIRKWKTKNHINKDADFVLKLCIWVMIRGIRNRATILYFLSNLTFRFISVLQSLDQDARRELTPLKLRAKAAKFAKATVKMQMASFKVILKLIFIWNIDCRDLLSYAC